MKRLPLLLALLACRLAAHDHIEAGVDPADPGKLALEGPAFQLITYFPPGERPSSYLPDFPGACFAGELTFSVEGLGELAIPDAPSRVRVEILSVTGPVGGEFSFWDLGATTPSETRPVGWSAGAADRPSWMASEPGIAAGHIHGRAFSTNLPGDFTVRFRVVDEAGLLAPSEAHTVLFRALAPPPFAFSITGGQARLRFTSRANLSYDVQRCTDLASGVWDYVGFPLDGNGLPLEAADPIGGVGHAVYRIVEYR